MTNETMLSETMTSESKALPLTEPPYNVVHRTLPPRHIAVQRIGALGDVILTTPVLRRFRQIYPDARITMNTAYPAVFQGNKYGIETTAMPGNWWHGADLFCDLDLAYERRPNMHVVQAYMHQAFCDTTGIDFFYAEGNGDIPFSLQQELSFRENYRNPFGRRVVAVHAAVAGWRNRTLPRQTWFDVRRGLTDAGFTPVLVGTVKDALTPGGPESKTSFSFLAGDLYGQTSFISSCCAFVGSDSALLHAAGATSTPIVGVFTCAHWKYRLPYRRGILGWHCQAISSELGCEGCLERAPVPTTRETCERGDIACVSAIKAKDIIASAINMAKLSSLY